MIKNNRGATLIELLAVLAIIGLVVLLLATAQNAWFDGTTDLQKQMFNQEKLRFAVETFVRDIEGAQTIDIVAGNSQPGEDNYTQSVTITSLGGVESLYEFNRTLGVFTLERGDIDVTLAINLDNFYMEGPLGSTYKIGFRLIDIDARTGTGYQILTTAQPIKWN